MQGGIHYQPFHLSPALCLATKCHPPGGGRDQPLCPWRSIDAFDLTTTALLFAKKSTTVIDETIFDLGRKG